MSRKEWKTQFSERKRRKSEAGSRIHKLYGALYDECGRMTLEEKGTESLYDFIQSYADSCDIHILLKRYQNGEADVLSKVQGFYGDYTQLPTNYAQLLNTVNAGKDLFDKLPVATRAEFGHSFNEFMASMCDGTLMQRLGYNSPSPAEPSPPPAVE